MPRRNLVIISCVALFSLLCYQRVDHNPYSRYLASVLEVVDERALERVPQQDLFEGAMRGIVEVLNKHIDENSAFISQQQRMPFESTLNQQFGGVGVMIKFEQEPDDPDAPRKLMVVNPPLVGTPAAKSGMRVRDHIQAIDGESTAEMSMDDVMEKMRGPIGTPVELTVLHAGEEEPVKFRIERATIDVDSVLGDKPLKDGSWDFRLQQDPRIGYLRISTFGRRTVDEIEQALAQLTEQGVEALILDLRENAGGQLDAAVATCRLFLRQGQQIVSIRGRDQRLEEEFVAREDGPYLDLPMAVLVNHHSASASEIVAACLQDHQRAVIVGSRTFGKGTVQHLIKIESGKSLLKLTAAKYWRPSNQNIHRRRGENPAGEDEIWGVTPRDEFRIELTEQQLIRRYEDRNRRDLYGRRPDSEKQPEKEQPAEKKEARQEETAKTGEPSGSGEKGANSAPQSKGQPGGDAGPRSSGQSAGDRAAASDAPAEAKGGRQQGDAAPEVKAASEMSGPADPQLQRAIEAMQRQIERSRATPRAA